MPADAFINPLTGQPAVAQPSLGARIAGSAAGSAQPAARAAHTPPRRGARAGGVAGGALKRAGLIDEDSGMRDASGPSRRGGHGGGASRPDGRGAGAASSARDRANPLARPPPRTPTSRAGGSSNSGGGGGGGAQATGVVYGIRGGGGAAGAGGAAGKGKNRVVGDAQGAPSVNAKTAGVLRQFLASRWSEQAQFLNLEAMAQDPILKRADLRPPGAPGATRDLGSVIWKLCADAYPNCVTISLAKNDFKTLVPVGTLPQFLPRLKNLSLEGNDLKWTRDLVFFASSKSRPTPRFEALQELILLGNPMQLNAHAAGNEAGYRQEVLARFSHLTMLDKQQVSEQERATARRSKGSSAAPPAATAGVETRAFPVAMGPAFHSPESGDIPAQFLQKFFTLYDKSRADLRPAYAANATFSVVQLNAVPPRAKAAGYQSSPSLPRQRDLNWKGYSTVPSHNIMQLSTRPATKGFPRGPNAIVATQAKLPRTTHPLTDPSKFLVDSWLLQNAALGARINAPAAQHGHALKQQHPPVPEPDAVLFISVQGEFQEAPSQGVRSFTRTFLVAPAAPASPAAESGWPCVVVSDQLTIRNYMGTKAWAPDALPQASNAGSSGAAPTTVPVTPATADLPARLRDVQPQPGLSPAQHDLALQLSAKSGLTYPFAVMCLAENAWEGQQAWQRFEELKSAGAIPAEGFAGP